MFLYLSFVLAAFVIAERCRSHMEHKSARRKAEEQHRRSKWLSSAR